MEITARGFGLMVEARYMSEGVSAEKLSARFKESQGTINSEMKLLKDMGLMETKTLQFGNAFRSQTLLTENGHAFLNRRLGRPVADKWATTITGPF